MCGPLLGDHLVWRGKEASRLLVQVGMLVSDRQEADYCRIMGGGYSQGQEQLMNPPPAPLSPTEAQ